MAYVASLDTGTEEKNEKPHTQCLGRDSNCACIEYKSEALLYGLTCSVDHFRGPGTFELDHSYVIAESRKTFLGGGPVE